MTIWLINTIFGQCPTSQYEIDIKSFNKKEPKRRKKKGIFRKAERKLFINHWTTKLKEVLDHDEQALQNFWAKKGQDEELI